MKRIKEICEKELSGNYTLEIIDLYQQPKRAIADQIVAKPTLVRKLPEARSAWWGICPMTKEVLSLFNYSKTKET